MVSVDGCGIAGQSGGADGTAKIVVTEGQRATMHCPPTKDKEVVLIQWFKEDNKGPIYEYQVLLHENWAHLENTHRKAAHQHRPRPDWQGRAFFRGGHEDSPALTMTKLKPRDQGTYVCKATFNDGASRTLSTALLVVGSTNQPTIFDEKGDEAQGIAGPYMEGDSLMLTCKANSDFRLTWYWDSAPAHGKDQWQVKGMSTQSKLTRHNLARRDRDTPITCVATNALGATLNTTVKLEIWTPASSVHIRARPFKDGIPASVECEVLGSRPAPLVTWYVGDEGPQDATFTHVQEDADVATSVLTLTVSAKDRGKTITCVVAHPVTEDRLNASFVVDVHYKPSLRLTVNATKINFGEDLFMECEVDANPPAVEVSWHLNGHVFSISRAPSVPTVSVPFTRAQLDRSDSGSYQCRAWNSCGVAVSNFVTLTVTGADGLSTLLTADFQVIALSALASLTSQVQNF
ncbi:cell adhesion molecule 2 [Rhipicephalus microplus]|uniref:cell adhesion molecule 2 n=1 Tax=Rhipicephalus microplus TaxID=6941 RepID=UPI003F6B21B5